MSLPVALKHRIYCSAHKVWQFDVWASACQRKPKLREIRIAPVIFRFIDFASFCAARKELAQNRFQASPVDFMPYVNLVPIMVVMMTVVAVVAMPTIPVV
jgi:hypothetical protein